MNDHSIALIIQIKNMVLIVCTLGLAAALFKISGGSWHSLWVLWLFVFIHLLRSSDIFLIKNIMCGKIRHGISPDIPIFWLTIFNRPNQ